MSPPLSPHLFPPVFGQIIANCDRPTLLSLGATCKLVRRMVDTRLFAELALAKTTVADYERCERVLHPPTFPTKDTWWQRTQVNVSTASCLHGRLLPPLWPVGVVTYDSTGDITTEAFPSNRLEDVIPSDWAERVQCHLRLLDIYYLLDSTALVWVARTLQAPSGTLSAVRMLPSLEGGNYTAPQTTLLRAPLLVIGPNLPQIEMGHGIMARVSGFAHVAQHWSLPATADYVHRVRVEFEPFEWSYRRSSSRGDHTRLWQATPLPENALATFQQTKTVALLFTLYEPRFPGRRVSARKAAALRKSEREGRLQARGMDYRDVHVRMNLRHENTAAEVREQWLQEVADREMRYNHNDMRATSRLRDVAYEVAHVVRHGITCMAVDWDSLEQRWFIITSDALPLGQQAWRDLLLESVRIALVQGNDPLGGVGGLDPVQPVDSEQASTCLQRIHFLSRSEYDATLTPSERHAVWTGIKSPPVASARGSRWKDGIEDNGYDED